MASKPCDPAKRFWAKVAKTADCWEWTASKFSNGYGQFFDGSNKVGAHRFSYKLHFGGVSADLKICHRCDNRSCVNPEHLFLGTQRDNMQDMVRKGRKVNGDSAGESNGRSILTDKIVRNIRAAYLAGLLNLHGSTL